jgi:hypothetical protein
VTEVWALPGYDVQALIGYGATGEVWRARELSTGDPVALKRLRSGADPAAVERLRREASVLRALDTPYVVRLRAVLGEGADTVLVLDLAGGGSLAALLAKRGNLDPGEVVTVAAPLAQALAAAHACGLVHGDVTPANVLFTGEGMPLLADLGLARIAGERIDGVDGTAEYVDPAVAAGGDPDSAADVWALAAVCHHMLSGSAPHDGDSADDVLESARAGSRAPLGLLTPAAPRALVSAVEQALAPDPSDRPDAAAFAAALRRAHAAAPVRLTGSAPAVPGPQIRPTHAVHAGAPAPIVPDARPSRRRLLIAGGAVALLVLAGVVGWMSGRSAPVELASVAVASPAHPSPVPAAHGSAAAHVSRPAAGTLVSPSAPDWRLVLDRLDGARAGAFATASAAPLLSVYAPGSPLLVSDGAAVARLAAAGQRALGVRHTVRSATVSSYTGTTARLRVSDVLAAYDLVDRSGRVVAHIAARGEETFAVTLVRTTGGWRLRDLAPV